MSVRCGIFPIKTERIREQTYRLTNLDMAVQAVNNALMQEIEKKVMLKCAGRRI